MPAAWWLGIHLELGAPGLVGAIGIGCGTAVLLLALRFRHVVDRSLQERGAEVSDAVRSPVTNPDRSVTK